jgi:hypothetical protein
LAGRLAFFDLRDPMSARAYYSAALDSSREVPDAVLVIASGSEGKRLNLGHFAPHRWQVHGTDRH